MFADAIQALGVVAVDVRGADFLCAGTYKWLLGAHGIAVFYVNPEIIEGLQVPYVGYRGVTNMFPADRFDRYELIVDARRFEEGMANYPGLFVLENGVTYLRSLGIDRITAYTAELVQRVFDGLDELGIEPLTTRTRTRRAGIVSFESVHVA